MGGGGPRDVHSKLLYIGSLDGTGKRWGRGQIVEPPPRESLASTTLPCYHIVEDYAMERVRLKAEYLGFRDFLGSCRW